MRQGKVKWYNGKKCYGFVTPLTPNEAGSIEDVFIHASSLKDAGIRFLNEGDLIEFEDEVRGDGKLSVTTMKLIERDEESARKFQERRSQYRGHDGGNRRREGGDRDHHKSDDDKRPGWAFWKK